MLPKSLTEIATIRKLIGSALYLASIALLPAYGASAPVATTSAPVAVVEQIDKSVNDTQPSWDVVIAPQLARAETQRQEAAEAARKAQEAQEALRLTQIIPTVHTGSVETWRGLVTSYFPADQVEFALAVMRCESGGNPQAVGDGGTPWPSYGLFQIRGLPGRPDPSWLVVPENNVSYAYNLWASSGWGPWSCARRV